MEAHSKLAQVATASKKCDACKKSKKLDKFPLSKAYPDGHQKVCKQCQKERSERRDAKLKKFLDDAPVDGAVTSFSEYRRAHGLTESQLNGMIEEGEVYAINIGEGKRVHWRIWEPIVPMPEAKSSEEAAGMPEMPDARSGLGMNMEQAMHLMSKIDRLGGMVDVVGQCFDGAGNFALELNTFFDELREVIING